MDEIARIAQSTGQRARVEWTDERRRRAKDEIERRRARRRTARVVVLLLVATGVAVAWFVNALPSLAS